LLPAVSSKHPLKDDVLFIEDVVLFYTRLSLKDISEKLILRLDKPDLPL
jgi:hypothetical protein